MQRKWDAFFSRYEVVIPLFIFLLFLAVSLPGVQWGAPALWNPDELIWRVDQALGGQMQFDVTEPDFNYPSLPKYVMYFIGSITYGLGRSTLAFIVAARSFSAILGALAGVLLYSLARMIGAQKRTSALAALLYVVSGVAAANSRFAHNDLYLQFFTLLCVYFAVRYQYTGSLSWLYASFLGVGLAASSKYTGGSLILLPVIVYLLKNRAHIRSQWLSMFWRLILGGLISYLGYGMGTPASLFDPIDYFSRVFVALRNYPQYGFNSGAAIGLFGQWRVFESAVGTFAYYLFIVSFIWAAIKVLLWAAEKTSLDEKQAHGMAVSIAAILIFDLPFMISINYIERYFIPFVPFLALLGALFVDEILRFASRRNLKLVQAAVVTLIVVGLAYSSLRLVSMAMLFMNDARIAATEYIAGMRGYQKSIEYTLYPPYIEKKRFERAHNYPIYFVKYPNDVVPVGGRFEYNRGEQGLLERDTDYFVIDSYTYDRFYTASICETNPVECDFFKQLIAGEAQSFRLLKEFTYHLPPYLPHVSISAVNPTVLIFERVR